LTSNPKIVLLVAQRVLQCLMRLEPKHTIFCPHLHICWNLNMSQVKNPCLENFQQVMLYGWREPKLERGRDPKQMDVIDCTSTGVSLFPNLCTWQRAAATHHIWNFHNQNHI
jgi:hypothetical protein